jgi:hypothetical protein
VSGRVAFVIDKVVLGEVLPRYFGFSYQFSLHLPLNHHHLSFEAGTVGRYWWESPKEGDHWEDQDVGGSQRDRMGWSGFDGYGSG